MHEMLKNLVERLHENAGANLESVTLYGSAAGGHLVEVHSDLNVLCTMRSLGVEELRRISGVVKWWTTTQHQPAPLFFTSQELREAADVFAIELLDMQQNHQVLYGSDVVAGISVPMNLHRIQVEHELRTALLKLRQHFLMAAENHADLAAVLAKSASSILTLLRHTLIAFEEKVPATPREIFERVAALTGAGASSFEIGLRLRQNRAAEPELVRAFGTYLSALERVISALENRAPKHRLQRVSKATS